MTESLARKYRPETFRDLAGQTVSQRVLFWMVHERTSGGITPLAIPRIPDGLLFTGPRGAGKTSTARIVAAALNCESQEIRPCTHCPSCKSVRDGTHPAVIEVDAASNGSVDQVRKLQELAAYDSGFAYRVITLDEAHSMSRDAFNALLKLLEEPPPRMVLILVTTEAGKILPTVASRCCLFPFQRISPADIAARLRYVVDSEPGLQATPELLEHLAVQADGALRDALMLLDQIAPCGVTTLAQYMQAFGERDFAPWLIAPMAEGSPGEVLARVGKWMHQSGDAALAVSRLTQCFRDILIVHAGGEVAATGPSRKARQELAALISVPQAVAALRVLWQVRGLAGPAAQDQLELAAVMCAEVIHPQPAVLAPVQNGNGSVNGNGHKPTALELAAVIGGSR